MMYADVCTDEIMFRVDLLDIRNTFSDMVFDNGSFLSIRIVEIQCFFVTEPYNIVAVNKSIAYGSRISFYHFIR